uniref:L-serine ammonia-lyase n=1 Tax=Plectus sambesii TaxID=2011161 RepID=A0A914VR17_9BILA
MDAPQITLDELKLVGEEVRRSPLVRRTPLLHHAQHLFDDNDHVHGAQLYIKLESAQNSGSFKIRGAVNQLKRLAQTLPKDTELFTFSSGNYGKAFATVARELNLRCRVLIMTVAPLDRVAMLEDLGAVVERHEPSAIAARKAECQAMGMRYCDPFDDVDLVKAYSSLAFEILEDVPEPDVLIIGIGGGGLLSGVATTLRAAGHNSMRIYGVEPETANVMSLCFAAGKRVDLPTVKSIASGLCSPHGGHITYPLCRKHINEVVLVSEQELIDTTVKLAKLGFVVEPSGAAALAAVLNGKIPESLSGKRVVVVVSGGNITLEALQQLISGVH